MSRLGKTHKGRMVDVDTSANAKLVDRGARLITEFGVACVPGDNFYFGSEAKADPQRGGGYLRCTCGRPLAVLWMSRPVLPTVAGAAGAAKRRG